MSSSTDLAIIYSLLALVLIIIFVLYHTIQVVRHAEVMIIERFGSYYGTLRPGLHFIVPFVDKPRSINWRYMAVTGNRSDRTHIISVKTDRIDLREHVLDFGRQHVITKDTVSIDIDALVYYRVTDPQLAIYNIQSLPDAIELLTQTTLRNIIAQITLDDTFSSREQINALLLSGIQRDVERWGVSVLRVEIMNILPPKDIKSVMENQIREERERRATVLRADGDRESAIVKSRGDAAKLVLQAEGAKTSRLQLAKGEADANMLVGTAEAECIKLLKEAITDVGVRATDYLVAIQYLNTLQQMTANAREADVVLVPNNTLDDISCLTKMNKEL